MPRDADNPRFFVPAVAGSAALAPGAILDLPRTEAHHAAHVLRLREGDGVELFDGRGASADGRIRRMGRGEVEVAVEAARPAETRTPPILHLAFATPKGSRLDWLLEKATELGAASLRPIVFERSVVRDDELSPAKRAKWLGHAIAAAKQSGLNFLPQIEEPMTLAAYLKSAAPGLYGDLADDAATLADAVSRLGEKELAILVGPEGGITDVERAVLCKARWTAVRLGRTTLRTETAAVALLAAALAVWK